MNIEIPCAYPVMSIESAKLTALPDNFGQSVAYKDSNDNNNDDQNSRDNYRNDDDGYQHLENKVDDGYQHFENTVDDEYQHFGDVSDSQIKFGDNRNDDAEYLNVVNGSKNKYGGNYNNGDDYHNEAGDHRNDDNYCHNDNSYHQIGGTGDQVYDDDGFRGLSFFKSPEIFRTLSIQTYPTDMKSRFHEYQSKGPIAIVELNGIELSFHIEGELSNDHPELKQFLCVYIVHTRVTIKNGDILPHGVFLSSTIIDGIIHLHFINVDKDCSVNSFPIERLDKSVCPLEKVVSIDPFYMENLLPQKYIKYLSEYCDSIPVQRTVQKDQQQLLHDDSFTIEDEYDMVDKLIASSKKPKRNSRHFVPNPSNILSTIRSTRVRTKPTEDKSNLQTLYLETENAKKKKVSISRNKRTPKKEVPVVISNVKKVLPAQLTNDREEFMKCLNDMKKASETLVKRQMEELNAQLNEVKAAKHKQQTQTLPSHDNSRSVNFTSRESMLNRNQLNHQNQNQQQQHQQHQQQPHEQQHMQNSRSCHELPRGSMQQQNQFYNNSNHHEQQQKQQFHYSSNDFTYRQQQKQFDENRPPPYQQQYQQYSPNDYSCGQQQMNNSNSFYALPQNSIQHQNQFDHHHHQHQQYQQLSPNDHIRYGQPNQSGSMQHQSQFVHHQLQHQQQQQQYHLGSPHYNAGQQQMQIYQHLYPQSNPREETSTFKKVMMCDMMDMIKKIN